MRIRLHFNKNRVKEGLPWTLHTSKGCYSASHVVFSDVPIETEEKPNNRTNPRYFIRCEGQITWDGNKATVVKV